MQKLFSKFKIRLHLKKAKLEIFYTVTLTVANIRFTKSTLLQCYKVDSTSPVKLNLPPSNLQLTMTTMQYCYSLNTIFKH